MRNRGFRFLGLALPLLLCGALLGQPALCTQESVVGMYALISEFTMAMPVPGAAQPVMASGAWLAIVSIDANGTISGGGPWNVNGSISQMPAPGIFQVHTDCTGVVNWVGGTVGSAVVMDGGKEIRTMVIQSAQGVPTMWGHWKRISPVPATVASAQCSTAAVHGVYAVDYEGLVIATPQGATQPVSMPTVMVSLASVDYQGQISGVGAMTTAGNSLPTKVTSGTVTVNTDCSAVTQMGLAAGPLTDSGKGWMVVLDGGNELWSVPTESNLQKSVAFGTWKRISPVPLNGQ